MFEDSLIESGGNLKTTRRATSFVAFLVQIGIIIVMVLIPLIFTEALPKAQLVGYLMAPPPPPPPPPPPAAAVHVVKQVQTDIVNGQLRTPTKIPKKVLENLKEERGKTKRRKSPAADERGRSRGRRAGWRTRRSDGRRDRRHHQLHTGCGSAHCHPAARTRFAGRVHGTSGAQGEPHLSAAGSAGAHRGHRGSAGRNQQDRGYSESAPDQRSPHAGSGRDRSREAVEVQALSAQWRTGRGGNYGSGELHALRRLEPGVAWQEFAVAVEVCDEKCATKCG